MAQIRGFLEAWDRGLLISTFAARDLGRLRIVDVTTLFVEDISIGERT